MAGLITARKENTTKCYPIGDRGEIIVRLSEGFDEKFVSMLQKELNIRRWSVNNLTLLNANEILIKGEGGSLPLGELKIRVLINKSGDARDIVAAIESLLEDEGEVHKILLTPTAIFVVASKNLERKLELLTERMPDGQDKVSRETLRHKLFVNHFETYLSTLKTVAKCVIKALFYEY